MEPLSRSGRFRSRTALAWAGGLCIALFYVALPDGKEPPADWAAERGEEGESDPTRPEILSVSPHDPFAGSTVAITHTASDRTLEAYAGKLQLRVLARRPGQMVAELPHELPAGDLKVRVATAEPVPFSARAARSKAFHIRVRAPNYRKVFRSLLGGAALLVLGIGFLSRGVRESMGVHAARLLTRASRHRALVFGLGALLGTAAQTTTGAAGVLAGLVSSRVLGPIPGAVAFLGAPLGAALAPLLVAGLVEPRDGLLAVAIGVLWLLLASNRRSHALAGLLLGTGLVAFGLQVLRPGLEPFFSDAMLWSFANRMRADSALDLLACAALGSLVVAGLHGPAPLILLVLGIAQATHHWDLRTLLALLSGTGLGAALGALITAPAGPESRALARLNLTLGALGTCLSLLSVDLWVALVEVATGPVAAPLHWTDRLPMSEFGLRLSLGFGLSQSALALVLLPLTPRVAAWLEARRAARERAEKPLHGALTGDLRASLVRVLTDQKTALGEMVALALTGVRRHGHEAEQTLAEARKGLDLLLSGPLRALSPSQKATASLAGAAFATLQLQNALDFLLRQTERMIDARVVGGADSVDVSALPWDDETLLRSLHRLVSEGLDAARLSLSAGEPLDLDSARVREISINRIEASARGVLLDAERAPSLIDSHLHVLQVVDAYEVSGNQVYRLAEILGQHSPAANLLAI